MGQIFDFRCNACEYSRQVSGRPDVGMTVRTTTVVCGICRDLFDVEVSDTPRLRRGGTPIRQLKCPRCDAPSLSRWVHPGPCPKCGHKNLARGGMTVLWD
jgi:transcription elongation factor Elf1